MNFKCLTPGKSVLNQKIESFVHEGQDEDYLYLMAGVHGDEPEGVYVLEQLFRWIKTQDFRLAIVVIPKLNVDGLRENSRTNSNGVDLNRNFPTDDWTNDCDDPKNYPGPKPLSEPENIYLMELFKLYPPSFVISFHSWKPILNYNGDCKDVAEFIYAYNDYQVAGDIGYPTPGSFGTFMPTKMNCPVLTYECPRLDQGYCFEDIWKQNEEGLKAYLKSL